MPLWPHGVMGRRFLSVSTHPRHQLVSPETGLLRHAGAAEGGARCRGRCCVHLSAVFVLERAIRPTRLTGGETQEDLR